MPNTAAEPAAVAAATRAPAVTVTGELESDARLMPAERQTLCQLVARRFDSLDECEQVVRACWPAWFVYRGGSHVALHLRAGDDARLAIWTERPIRRDGAYRGLASWPSSTVGDVIDYFRERGFRAVGHYSDGTLERRDDDGEIDRVEIWRDRETRVVMSDCVTTAPAVQP